MEDSFKLLEEKVQKAATRLRELKAERDKLLAELRGSAGRADKTERALQAETARAQKAEAELAAASARAAKAERELAGAAGQPKEDGRAEVAERALARLQHEREELRKGIVKLVEILATLE